MKVFFKEIVDDERDLNGEGYREVPDSKFSISRTAFKDNKSVYKINDRAAKAEEVTKLLREKGIDLGHNRFLILQVSLDLGTKIWKVLLNALGIVRT